MTDDWTDDDIPIFDITGRSSLLMATKGKPFAIGRGFVDAKTDDAMLAIDKELSDMYNLDLRPQDYREAPDFEPKFNPVTASDEAINRFKESMQRPKKSPRSSRYEADADWLGSVFDLPYQVSYYFPNTVRPNKVGKGAYGAGKFTFRNLYEFLCDTFNGGERFIEKYFATVFKEHMQTKFDSAVMELKRELRAEIDKRRAWKKRWKSNYDEWAGPWVRGTLTQLARETKKDMATSLATRGIPLRKVNLSEATLKTRRDLGLSSKAVFYATGRLIKSIVVTIVLLDPATAGRQQEARSDA